MSSRHLDAGDMSVGLEMNDLAKIERTDVEEGGLYGIRGIRFVRKVEAYGVIDIGSQKWGNGNRGSVHWNKLDNDGV